MNAERLAQVSFAKIINSRQQKGGTRLHKHLLVLRILQKVREVFTGGPSRLTRPESLAEFQLDHSDDEEEIEADVTPVDSTMEAMEETVVEDMAELTTDDDHHQQSTSLASTPGDTANQSSGQETVATTTSHCSATTCTIVFSPDFSTSLCCSSARVAPTVDQLTRRRKRLNSAAVTCRLAKKRFRLGPPLHPVLRAGLCDLRKTKFPAPNTSSSLQSVSGVPLRTLTLTSVARLPCGTILATTSDSLRPKSAILTPS